MTNPYTPRAADDPASDRQHGNGHRPILILAVGTESVAGEYPSRDDAPGDNRNGQSAILRVQ